MSEELDAVIFTEESSFNEGYEEGKIKGKKEGTFEGSELGSKHGSELGSRAGYILGFCIQLLNSSDLQPKVNTKLPEKIIQSIEKYKISSVDRIADLDKIETQFQALKNILHVGDYGLKKNLSF